MAFCSRREEWEYVRNNAVDTKVVKAGGGGGAPGVRAEILLQPMVRTMVRQSVPLQSMEVHGGADIHLQPMEHTGACRCLTQAVSPRRAHAGADSGQDLWTHGERSPHWSRFTGRTCDPMGDPHWSSLFLKDCTPCKGPTLGQSVPEGLHPV